MKVDAEGYDYAVLAALEDLLSEQRPFIRAEVFKLLDLAQRARLYDLLVDLGYDVFHVESEVNYLGARLARQDLMAWRHYDVFCIPRKGGSH
ncbi:MAG: hypothetical protein HYS14_03515 [Candidatus Rokubacteria bacterium]|nr:hypothetical protein [Candidatus Rokubacteria bacterium]MBI3457775.1 hypothetical protein [Candidatus Rokubacteria bacterium]